MSALRPRGTVDNAQPTAFNFGFEPVRQLADDSRVSLHADDSKTLPKVEIRVVPLAHANIDDEPRVYIPHVTALARGSWLHRRASAGRATPVPSFVCPS